MTFKVEELEIGEEGSFECKSNGEIGENERRRKGGEENRRVLGGSFEGESEEEQPNESEVGFMVGGRAGEGAGRFLLAAKTFQPGQPVLLESPLVQVIEHGNYNLKLRKVQIIGAKSTS